MQVWRSRQLHVAIGVLAIVAVIAILDPHLPGRPGIVTPWGYGRHAAISAQKVYPPTVNVGPKTPEQRAASIHVPASLAPALRTWSKGPGGATLSQISNNVGMALQSGGTNAYAPMKAACASLARSVSAAQTDPAIPDAGMQTKYSAALSVLAKAASDCASAISVHASGESVSTQENQTVLQLAQSELGSAITALASIKNVIAAAAGS